MIDQTEYIILTNISGYFYGSYHWEFKPVEDRLLLLDALSSFEDGETNLFIEAINPTLLDRIRFWRIGASYKTNLFPDALSPPSTKYHIPLNKVNLQVLAEITKRRGLGDHIAHIKGYRYEEGLFWFHGFNDECDNTLSCSQHVSETQISRLEEALGLKPEKIFGELKTDRETREYFERLFKAFQQGGSNDDS